MLVLVLILMVLLLAGLLFSFQGVVAQGVIQGGLRRSAEAERADDVLRCRLISHARQRRECLSKVPPA